MSNFWRQFLMALTHTGPAYEPAAAREQELRDLLATLIERWQDQLAGYVQTSTNSPDADRRKYARMRHTRLRWCIHDIETVLNTGRLPLDLLTDEELAALTMPAQDAEFVDEDGAR